MFGRSAAAAHSATKNKQSNQAEERFCISLRWRRTSVPLEFRSSRHELAGLTLVRNVPLVKTCTEISNQLRILHRAIPLFAGIGSQIVKLRFAAPRRVLHPSGRSVIRQLCCRCRLQRLVRSHEILPAGEQGQHRFMVLPFLGERIRQPSEAPVLRPDRQFGSLCGDMSRFSRQ